MFNMNKILVKKCIRFRGKEKKLSSTCHKHVIYVYSRIICKTLKTKLGISKSQGSKKLFTSINMSI